MEPSRGQADRQGCGDSTGSVGGPNTLIAKARLPDRVRGPGFGRSSDSGAGAGDQRWPWITASHPRGQCPGVCPVVLVPQYRCASVPESHRVPLHSNRRADRSSGGG